MPATEKTRIASFIRHNRSSTSRTLTPLTPIDISRYIDDCRYVACARTDHLLLPPRGSHPLGRGGNCHGGAVQGAQRSRARAAREPNSHERRGRLPVRSDRAGRTVAADGLASHEEACRRRAGRARAARQVGVFLVEARRRREARGRRRPEGGVLLMTTTSAEGLREEVRRRYAESARAVSEGSSAGCGGGSCCEGETDAVSFGEALYDAKQRGELPDAAALASLGCGNPVL